MYWRIYLFPRYFSNVDNDRKRFLRADLVEDSEHRTPLERIDAYQEFVVWIRPRLSPSNEEVLFIGVGWTSEGPEVFYCRNVPR